MTRTRSMRAAPSRSSAPLHASVPRPRQTAAPRPAARGCARCLRTCRRRSSTTRSGCCGASMRTSSRGSSASTVAALVSTAPLCARQCCTSARASSLVIHLLAPFGQRGAAIETGRRLEPHERPAMRACACRKPAFSASASRSSRPDSHRHAGVGQALRARAIHQRIGIADGVHHAAHARGQQHIDARRCASEVIAGLERDVGGGAARAFAGGADRVGFGVRLTGTFVPAFAHDFVVARQHGADARIRIRAVQAARRELQRAAHGDFIECAEITHSRRPRRGFGGDSPGNSSSWSSLGILPRRWRRRSISSRKASTSWKCR